MGTPSNVSVNDAFDDVHLDHVTLRNAGPCCAASVSPSFPLLLCAGGTSYGRAGDYMRWHVVGAHGSNRSGGSACGRQGSIHTHNLDISMSHVVMLCLDAACMRECIDDL